MVASGNDFVVIDNRSKGQGVRYTSLVKKLCDRKFGVGSDGVLLLEKTKKADIRMRIFNADGSEADMCGNGARCATLYYSSKFTAHRSQIKIETKAGIIEAKVSGNSVKIKLTDPKNIKLDIPIMINNRPLKVNYINTGVPHAVIFVEGLDKIDVKDIGRQVRNHRKFNPAGTNVDFVEVLNDNTIKVRTYERGVEDETLACGTGSVASALIYSIRYIWFGNAHAHASANNIVKVCTQGGELLKVYFDRIIGQGFKNTWLEGKAKIVYIGEYHV